MYYEVKIDETRPFGISNPKPDLHNINAQSKFSENPLIFRVSGDTVF